MTHSWARVLGTTAQVGTETGSLLFWCHNMIRQQSGSHRHTHTLRAISEGYAEERGQKAVTVRNEMVCGSLQSLFSSQTNKGFALKENHRCCCTPADYWWMLYSHHLRMNQESPLRRRRVPTTKCLHPTLQLKSFALQLLTYLIRFSSLKVKCSDL